MIVRLEPGDCGFRVVLKMTDGEAARLQREMQGVSSGNESTHDLLSCLATGLEEVADQPVRQWAPADKPPSGEDRLRQEREVETARVHRGELDRILAKYDTALHERGEAMVLLAKHQFRASKNASAIECVECRTRTPRNIAVTGRTHSCLPSCAIAQLFAALRPS